MKLYSTFFLLLVCSISLFGQEIYKYDYKQGYKFINKAEKSLRNGNLSKAEIFINKAKLVIMDFVGMRGLRLIVVLQLWKSNY